MNKLKAYAVLLWSAPLWLAYMLMVGVLYVIGVPLIWFAARRCAWTWRKSAIFDKRHICVWYWSWMDAAWGNEQDGVDGLAFNDEGEYCGSLKDWPNRPFESRANRIFQWSALRNSTNNLRFMHYFVSWLGWINPRTIEPKRIRWIYVTDRLTITRQGPYAGLTYYFNRDGLRHRFMFGWKLHPGMRESTWWPSDPCWKGVGFTCGSIRRVES